MANWKVKPELTGFARKRIYPGNIANNTERTICPLYQCLQFSVGILKNLFSYIITHISLESE